MRFYHFPGPDGLFLRRLLVYSRLHTKSRDLNKFKKTDNKAILKSNSGLHRGQ